MNNKPYYINAEMLGPVATDEQAERMVELLAKRGYNVEYGEGTRHYADAPDYKDWKDCLDIISKA
jgi:hypothetical protein